MKKYFKKTIVSIITWQARVVLRRYRPKIIAITGSVGKTSTKDTLFTVLSKFKKVRKSEKSFNSEIGLPLTILGLPNGWDDPFIWLENILKGILLIIFKQTYPEYLILEIGIGKPGDIKKNVLPWLKTDVVIMTRFPDKPVHVEFFDSVEKVIEEKSYLIHTLKKDGLLILNHDDPKVFALHKDTKCQFFSYGLSEGATYRCLYPIYLYKEEDGLKIPTGINFKIEYEGNTFPVMMPNTIGLHNANQATAVITCAHRLGCDLFESIKALSDHTNPPGRLSLIKGINNSTIIDDTYNSSPVAMESAISVLKEIEGKHRIAVLGDMLELGKYTEEEHLLVGERISSVADLLIVVGPRAKSIAQGALTHGFKKGNIHFFDLPEKAGEFLLDKIKKNDVILVKGSQGIRLEKAVEVIMEDKELKKKLLCRQDKEWLKR